MKRLTKCSPLTENEVMSLSLTDLYMRLKAYEDTGLEPEEVERTKKLMLRLALTKHISKLQSGKTGNTNMGWIESLIKEAKTIVLQHCVQREFDEGYGGLVNVRFGKKQDN